jgi:membrane protease YdiL (CAAX protease family)
LFFLFLTAGHPVAETGRERRPPWMLLGLAVVAMVVASPMIDSLHALNQNLPVSGEWLQQMRDWEDQASRLTNAILRPATFVEGLTTFIMIAILAAVWEEFIFRGILQRIIEAWTKNGHVAVWGTALVFAAIHFQFYSIVPRIALGIVLGYLFLWSRNLWIPIIGHFLNNATYIVYSWVEGPEKAAAVGDPSPWLGAGSAAALAVLLFLVHRYRDTQAPPPWHGLDPATGRLPMKPDSKDSSDSRGPKDPDDRF